MKIRSVYMTCFHIAYSLCYISGALSYILHDIHIYIGDRHKKFKHKYYSCLKFTNSTGLYVSSSSRSLIRFKYTASACGITLLDTCLMHWNLQGSALTRWTIHARYNQPMKTGESIYQTCLTGSSMIIWNSQFDYDIRGLCHDAVCTCRPTYVGLIKCDIRKCSRQMFFGKWNLLLSQALGF
jgi:hypothetical protein